MSLAVTARATIGTINEDHAEGEHADHLTRVFEIIREGGFAQTTGAVQAITGHEPRSIADFARDQAGAFLP